MKHVVKIRGRFNWFCNNYIVIKALSPLGEWLSDRRNIHGICEYTDGSRYIGSWKEDVRDGYGTILHGSVELSGKWRDDELLNALPKKGINLRSPRMRAKVRLSFDSAAAAAKLAMEKYKTAFLRSVTARKIAESAKIVAEGAIKHGAIARLRAEQFDVSLPEPRKFRNTKYNTIKTLQIR